MPRSLLWKGGHKAKRERKLKSDTCQPRPLSMDAPAHREGTIHACIAPRALLHMQQRAKRKCIQGERDSDTRSASPCELETPTSRRRRQKRSPNKRRNRTLQTKGHRQQPALSARSTRTNKQTTTKKEKRDHIHEIISKSCFSASSMCSLLSPFSRASFNAASTSSRAVNL